MTIDSVDRLHQALDASRINRDRVLKLIRGAAAPLPLYVTVRPSEVLRGWLVGGLQALAWIRTGRESARRDVRRG